MKGFVCSLTSVSCLRGLWPSLGCPKQTCLPKGNLSSVFSWMHFHREGSGRLPSSPSRSAKHLRRHLWGNYSPRRLPYIPRSLRVAFAKPWCSVYGLDHEKKPCSFVPLRKQSHSHYGRPAPLSRGDLHFALVAMPSKCTEPLIYHGLSIGSTTRGAHNLQPVQRSQLGKGNNQRPHGLHDARWILPDLVYGKSME